MNASEFTKDVVDASDAISLLAGQRGFRNVWPRALYATEIQLIVQRAAAAKAKSGLSARQFRDLRGDVLRAFARRHGLKFLEVRFAQTLADLTWAMRHTHRVSARAAHARKLFNSPGALQ